MSWIDFEFELRRDYPLSEIVDVLTWIDDSGGIDKVKEKLRLMRSIDSDVTKKYNALESQFKRLEERHNNLMREQNDLIFKLLVELREYAHSTYVCVDLDEIRDIIVYRPYEGDLFQEKYTYHFFIVAKGCPKELLYVFDKMLPINEICKTLIDVLLYYCPMEVNKQ